MLIRVTEGVAGVPTSGRRGHDQNYKRSRHHRWQKPPISPRALHLPDGRAAPGIHRHRPLKTQKTTCSSLVRSIPRCLGDFPQIIERINPAGMAVAPNRLDGVAAHVGDAPELKRLGRQRFVRILINVPHDVGLAFAPGAGTTTSQRLQPHKTLAAILPSDGQFIANLLNIHRSHRHSVMGSHVIGPQTVFPSATPNWLWVLRF